MVALFNIAALLNSYSQLLVTKRARHSAKPWGYEDTRDPVSPWRSLHLGGQTGTWDQGPDEQELHEVLREQEAGVGSGKKR